MKMVENEPEGNSSLAVQKANQTTALESSSINPLFNFHTWGCFLKIYQVKDV